MTTQTVDAATRMTDPVVTPAEADREAWIEYEDFGPEWVERVRSGKDDRTIGLQIIARHAQQARLEGERAGMEKAARIADQHAVIHPIAGAVSAAIRNTGDTK